VAVLVKLAEALVERLLELAQVVTAHALAVGVLLAHLFARLLVLWPELLFVLLLVRLDPRLLFVFADDAVAVGIHLFGLRVGEPLAGFRQLVVGELAVAVTVVLADEHGILIAGVGASVGRARRRRAGPGAGARSVDQGRRGRARTGARRRGVACIVL